MASLNCAGILLICKELQIEYSSNVSLRYVVSYYVSVHMIADLNLGLIVNINAL